MKSDVYFIKVDSSDIKQRTIALKKILDVNKPASIYKKDEFIPIKLTVGDFSCVYNVNPELVECVVKHVKNKQTKPFLFDTNVIYHGQRQNTLDHLNLIQNKGFGYSRIGVPFIIADGLFGQDGKEFKINAANIKKIKIVSFIGMLESLLVLTHPTGHILSGYAGAIKNVAMGMSCRPTKQIQHSSLKPSVIEQKCTACGCCINFCPVNAISLRNNKAIIDQRICIGCGECICACKYDAISVNWHEDAYVFCKRMIEVANFILSKFRNKFFINFAFDITKDCDCISSKDNKIISANLGILTSNDIVSIDKATVDLIIKNKRSNFFDETRDVYEEMLKYASRCKMGNIEYNLINI